MVDVDGRLGNGGNDGSSGRGVLRQLSVFWLAAPPEEKSAGLMLNLLGSAGGIRSLRSYDIILTL